MCIPNKITRLYLTKLHLYASQNYICIPNKITLKTEDFKISFTKTVFIYKVSVKICKTYKIRKNSSLSNGTSEGGQEGHFTSGYKQVTKPSAVTRQLKTRGIIIVVNLIHNVSTYNYVSEKFL